MRVFILVSVLRDLKATAVEETDQVFPGMPRIKRFRRDLKKAGIEYRDALGRVGDFHALRYTFNTNLQVTGAMPRVSMELMRHSDLRLTMKTYLDATLLLAAAAVNALPSYLC